MLIDTHSHINMMVKKEFDIPLTEMQARSAQTIIEQAACAGVTRFVNVGTSLVESNNCVLLARMFKDVYATIGTHPNDLKKEWRDDIGQYKKLLQEKERHKIVGIGEIGLDYHYPGFNKQLQYDGFKAQIELALEYNLPLVIHTRDAGDEILRVLQEYKQNGVRGTIHCFSEGLDFAREAIALGFVLGIGGTLTYPKNETLRQVCREVDLKSIILETDAPFLPPQSMRGQQNSPAAIAVIAQYLADLKEVSLQEVAQTTSATAAGLFTIV